MILSRGNRSSVSGAGGGNDDGADGDLADGAVGGLGIHVHDGALDDGFGEGDPKREFLDRVKRMPTQFTYSHYADELTRLLSHLNARDNTKLPVRGRTHRSLY